MTLANCSGRRCSRLQSSRARPAARAHRRARVAGDRPHRQRAIGLALGLDDPQALDTEQRRSDILGQVPAAFRVMVSLGKIHDLKKPRASRSLRRAGALTPDVRFRSQQVRRLRTYRAGRASWRSRAVAQTARVRVARQPDASAAAATASRTVSKTSCSGQYWLAGW